jgi:thiol-disulfide isomerase/thioredoxin
VNLGDHLPALDAATFWICGEPRASDLAGRAVLVHFWTVSCPLCSEAVADIARWREQFDPAALACVAICALRPDETADRARFERDAREKMRVVYPCALDGARAITERFGNPYAPAYFIFDREHALRHRQEGNHALSRVDQILRNALA